MRRSTITKNIAIVTVATLITVFLFLTTPSSSWSSWFSRSTPQTAPLLQPTIPNMLGIPSLPSLPSLPTWPTLPSIPGFQITPSQLAKPFSLSFDAQPVFMRETIIFHGDQWQTNISKTRTEIGASTTLMDWVKVRYSVVPGISVSESTVPVGLLKIGLTDFGTTNANGTSAGTATSSSTKPITIDWTEGLSHRLTLTGLINYSLKPCIVLEYPSYKLTGTGEKEGKTVTDSQSFAKLVGGIGASLDYPIGNSSRVEAIFVGSNCYLLAEGRYSFKVLLGLSGFVGGFWKQITFDELKARSWGPMAGASVSF